MIFLVRLVVSDGCYAFWVRLVALIFMQGFCSFSLLPHLAQLLLQLSDFFLCLIQLPSVLIHSFIFCVSVVLAVLVCNSLWHLSCLHCLFFFRPHSLDNFVVIRLLSFLDATHSILPSLLLLHNLQTRHFFDPFGLSLLISPSHQFLLSLDSILDCLANERVGGSPFNICDIQAPKVLLILNSR